MGKCWKKISQDAFGKSWSSKAPIGSTISVTQISGKIGKSGTYLVQEGRIQGIFTLKRLKSKKSAETFARSYMNKHNTC